MGAGWDVLLTYTPTFSTRPNTGRRKQGRSANLQQLKEEAKRAAEAAHEAEVEAQALEQFLRKRVVSGHGHATMSECESGRNTSLPRYA